MSGTKPIKILLVEDSPSDALLFRQYIAEVEDVTFELHHEKTLAEALAALSIGEFDAVILDLGLPDSNGIETFEKVREQDDSIPIVVLSGMEDRAGSMNAVRHGADSYLVKDSVTSSRIAICILSAMRNRTLGRNSFTRQKQKSERNISPQISP